MKNRYKSGADFERRIERWYQEQGFETIRSAGSHGVTDVTAIGLGACNGVHPVVIFNSIRTNGKWTEIEKEVFETAVKMLWVNGRYVWRGDKKSGYKILFKDVI